MKKLLYLAGIFLFIVIVSFKPVIPKKKKKTVKKATTSVAAKKPPVVIDSTSFNIVIDKSDYELKVYDDEGWLATYPIVFGSKDLSDKMKEGDRRTPDGSFRIIPMI
jgi:murein L,D-transpeptidase YafK